MKGLIFPFSDSRFIAWIFLFAGLALSFLVWFFSGKISFLTSVAGPVISLLLFGGIMIFAGYRRNIHAVTEKDSILAALMNRSSIAIIVRDINGVITDWNTGARKLYGYAAAEMRGRKIPFNLPVGFAGKIQYDKTDPAGTDVMEHYETVICRKDGKSVYAGIDNWSVRNESGKITGYLTVLNDITGRIQTEKRLLQEKLYSDSIINSMPGIFCILDEKGNLKKWNSNFERTTGCMHDVLPDMKAFNVMCIENSVFVENRIMLAFKTGSEAVEAVLLAKDSMKYYYYFTGVRTVIEECLYLLVTGTDITERKVMEKSLMIKNLVFDSSIAANCIMDEKGRIIQANARFIELWGYHGRHEVLGKSSLDFFFRREDAAGIDATLKENGEWEGEYTAKKRGGDLFFVRGHASILRNENGEVMGFQSSVMDITEQRKAGEVQKRLAAILEASGDTVIIVDINGKILYLNNAGRMLLGLAMDQQAESFTLVDFIPEFLRSVIINDILPCLVKNGSWTGDIILVNLEGREIPVSITGVAYGEKASDTKYAALIIRDITEQKRTEYEIRKLNAVLKDANRELSNFAYSVSHDLRSPIRGIDGWSLALLEDYGGILDDHAREYINTIRSETGRMTQLIDALLELSKVGRVEMKTGAFDMSRAASEVSAELSGQNPARKVLFNIQPGMIVEGEKTLLLSMLRNLLENAWKYTLKCETATIEFGKFIREGKTVYYIRDNGAGFDMALADRLFTPFARLHRQEDFPGMGIGLATVQRIINRHGGRIWAEGKPGEGATFYFSI